MNRNTILTLLIIALCAYACSEDDTTNNSQFKQGVVVVNQGFFGSGTGTLTHRDRESSIVTQDIFSAANQGAVLGNVAQSMIDFEGKSYISINNGGKVVVVDSDDFILADTIGEIAQGRYFASNGKNLYLTAWGNTGSNGGIYVIDPSLNKVENFIELGNGPEGIVFANDFLYVAKGGGFGLDSLVLIIDPLDNAVEKTLIMGDNPQQMVKDNSENVYVICSGYSDWMDPTKNTPGRLVKISNQEVVWSITLQNGANNLAIDKENGYLYYVSGGSVMKQDMNLPELDAKMIRQLPAYALGFDEEEKRLYMSDAKNFSGQGQAFVYSTEDIAVDSFPTGIIPGYFHFR